MAGTSGIRLPEELQAEIKQAATEDGVLFSVEVRILLRMGLDERKEKVEWEEERKRRKRAHLDKGVPSPERLRRTGS